MAGRVDEGPAQMVVATNGQRLCLAGTLSRESAEALRRELDRWRGSGALELDLADLEIVDPVGVLASVDAIRALAKTAEHLVIRGAPQLLGHNLYRSGLLEASSGIELVEMREDEPYV
jgi:ABC-type transporter Mla MlaB component